MNNINNLFIVVSKKALKKHTPKFQEFFSVPVEVIPVYSCVATGMLYAHSPLQNDTYPLCSVNKKTGGRMPSEGIQIVRWYQLSKKKLESARRIAA